MAMVCARIRLVVAAIAFLILAAAAAPVAAQQPGSVDPNADAVKEQQLLDQFSRIQGLGSIPDTKSYVIEQPMGREWRLFHEVWLHWIAGVVIFGVIALLVVFYFIRGRNPDRGWALGTHGNAVQQLRALRSLDRRGVVRHPRAHRLEHHVRQGAHCCRSSVPRHSPGGRSWPNMPTISRASRS